MESLECLNDECLTLLQSNSLLRPLIRAELIKSILSKVSIEKEIADLEISNYKKYLGLEKENDFKAWLARSLKTEKDFADQATTIVKLKKYITATYGHKVEAKFLEIKNNLDSIVYSLIRLQSLYKAKEIYLRLEGNEANFGDLASEFSEGIENKTRGIVGPVPLETANPELIPHLRNNPVGEIQPPVRIGNAYVIIRVESRESAKLDHHMDLKIKEELFNESIEAQTDVLFNELLMTKVKKDYAEGKISIKEEIFTSWMDSVASKVNEDTLNLAKSNAKKSVKL